MRLTPTITITTALIALSCPALATPPPTAPYVPYVPYWAPPPPPERMDYSEGEEVPPGYHVESAPRPAALIAGAAVLGAGLTASATMGVFVATQPRCEALADESPIGGGGFSSSCGDPIEDALPYFIPIVGPWLGLADRADSNSHGDEGEEIGFTMLGVAQGAGLLTMLAGAIFREKILVRDDLAIAPVHQGNPGLDVSWAF